MQIKLIKQNEANDNRKGVPIKLVNTADDSPFTGSLGVGDTKIAKPGGTAANTAGTWTHKGSGDWLYYPTAGELDTLGTGIIQCVKTGLYLDSAYFDVVPFDPYDGSGLGLTRLDVALSSRLAAADYEDVDAILDAADTIETGVTLRKAIRYIVAYAVGNVTGGGSGTETFSAAGNPATTRFTSTPTSAGSRTVMLSGG